MTKEYIDPRGFTYIRLSELPEDQQKGILDYINGQPVPQVEGLTPPEAIFSRDYYKFLAKSNGHSEHV